MSETTAEITIRLLDEHDGDEVRRLAQRDSAEVPRGLVLGALIGGRLLVAHSLSTGDQVADPFNRTIELRTLVAARARQLKGEHRGRRRLFGRRSTAALPGSPPGGGGRLLTLDQRAN
jgi:hypothetical protein